jgi:hypothetical protein
VAWRVAELDPPLRAEALSELRQLLAIEMHELVWLDVDNGVALTPLQLDEVGLKVILRRPVLRDDERRHVQERVVLRVLGSIKLIEPDQQVLVQVVAQDIRLDDLHGGIELKGPGGDPNFNGAWMTYASELLVEIKVGRDPRLE